MSVKFRGVENLHLEKFNGVGKYDIPELKPCTHYSKDFIAFDKANVEKNPENKSVHFFLDDYAFLRVWNNPDMQIEKLKKFDSIAEPDFSMYIDYPMALNLWNHYRNMWCGAYWQEHGINVIPAPGWSTPDTYDFCFDGQPKNSIVIVSTVGTIKGKMQQEFFKLGFKEMEKRLKPTEIILYGELHDWMNPNDYTRIGTPNDRFDKLKKE